MLLDELRQHTRSHHTRLEQMNGMPSSREEYVGLLERFYGFVGPWEKALAEAASPEDPLRENRGKTAWLETDLTFFGHSTEAQRDLPRCSQLPSTGSRAEMLGACYVLEGSTLGGQFITRHLASTLDVTPDRGGRYFHGYGAETGRHWQAFRQELVANSSAAHDPVIIRAAQNTFELMSDWFSAQPASAK